MKMCYIEKRQECMKKIDDNDDEGINPNLINSGTRGKNKTDCLSC